MNHLKTRGNEMMIFKIFFLVCFWMNSALSAPKNIKEYTLDPEITKRFSSMIQPGDPYRNPEAYAQIMGEKLGTPIHQIIPVNDDIHKAQASSFGSQVEFLPHTENVYQIPPLKFFTLLCLRGDPKVATRIIFLNDILSFIQIESPEKYHKIVEDMKKSLYTMTSGPSFQASRIEEVLPILEETVTGETIFRLNVNPGRTDGVTEEAAETVQFLKDVILSKKFSPFYQSIHLKKGDLILFNNWKIMHSRDSFEIDPMNWRWLQRCYFAEKSHEK